MELEQWRQDRGFSYEKLAREMDITTAKVFRICKKRGACIRLHEAYAIVQLTKGEVDYCDLLDSVDC